MRKLWSRTRPAAVLLTLVLSGCGEPPETGSAGFPEASYVDSKTCARCHRREHGSWTGSHHHLAMQEATEATVLGDFDDAVFERHGVTSSLYREGDAFHVRTDGPDGQLEDYVVEYTFGVDPLQQYLVEVGKGHLHVLPICWDVHEERWFHVYDEPIAHDDPLHWTGPYQNWNYMCAECHSTDLRRNYDLATNTYDTTYFEISVGCQACHGPGSKHVAWAEHVKTKGNRYAEDDPKGLVVDLSADDSREQVETCARCHSRRNVVSGEFGHGDPLLDHYDPELLVAPLYFPDGQILDEVYVYGSFVQSKKYHAGVRCTDCHDPHTARPKANDNELCVQCHRPDPPERFPTLKAKPYDDPAHHHHEQGSQGALCVSCHMPATTYMQNDPRRDHGFRIPRPDLTESLGVPNACNGCHETESPAWATAETEAWFPDGAGRGPHFAEVFAAARKGRPNALHRLVELAEDAERPAIVRATALREMTRFGSPLVVEVAARNLDDAEGLVRLAAVHGLRDVLERGTPASFVPRKVALLAPRLRDALRVVRGEAARALADVAAALPARHAPAYQAALAEYVARQESLADRADAHLNLGALHEALGEDGRAEAAYRTALSVNEAFIPVRFNLANLLNRRGRNAEAEVLLREVVERMPAHGDAHYSLGLLLAEMERFGDASSALTEAAGLLPGRPRIHYNRALVLQQLGQHGQAEEALLSAEKLAPDDPRIVHALALLNLERRRFAAARRFARRLLELAPDAPDARRLLEAIDRRAAR